MLLLVLLTVFPMIRADAVHLKQVRNMGSVLNRHPSTKGGDLENRAVTQIRDMMDCGPKWDHPAAEKMAFYGCYCGIGGRGTPVDEIDVCCKEHDECYEQLGREGCSAEYWEKYDLVCVTSGPNCNTVPNAKDECKRKLCECDRFLVECWWTLDLPNRPLYNVRPIPWVGWWPKCWW